MGATQSAQYSLPVSLDFSAVSFVLFLIAISDELLSSLEVFEVCSSAYRAVRGVFDKLPYQSSYNLDEVGCRSPRLSTR